MFPERSNVKFVPTQIPDEGLAVEVPGVGGEVQTDEDTSSNPKSIRPVFIVPVVAALAAYKRCMFPVVDTCKEEAPEVEVTFNSITNPSEGLYRNGVVSTTLFQLFVPAVVVHG